MGLRGLCQPEEYPEHALRRHVCPPRRKNKGRITRPSYTRRDRLSSNAAMQSVGYRPLDITAETSRLHLLIGSI